MRLEQLAPLLPAVDGEVALAAVVGSTAYGIAEAGSDVDVLGVYVTRGENLCGLNVQSAVTATLVKTEPDVALHELGKFATLALKANPTVTELLWADDYVTCTDAGRALVDIRHAFLSDDQVRHAYLGYAQSQIRKAAERRSRGLEGLDAGGAERVKKAARHALRLVLAAEQLVSVGKLHLNAEPHRDEICSMADLAFDDMGSFLELMTAKIASVSALESVLPHRPDLSRVEQTVRTIRRRSLGLGASSG